MAASMAPPSSDRICFKFQTNEFIRPKCLFLHKTIMSEKKKEDQNYVAKLPGKKDKFTSKNTEGNIDEKKFKGKSDLRNNNSKDTNGMHDNIPLTKEYQMELGEGESKPTPSNARGYSKDKLRYSISS